MINEFTNSVQATKKAILKDLLGLPASASILDIVYAKLRLPKATPPKMADSKVKSIASKLSCIPQQCRTYYAGYDVTITLPDDAESEPTKSAVKQKGKVIT